MQTLFTVQVDGRKIHERPEPDEWLARLARVPCRYGWVGGTSTSGHIIPERNTVAILFTQVEWNDSVAPTSMRDFWRLAAQR